MFPVLGPVAHAVERMPGSVQGRLEDLFWSDFSAIRLHMSDAPAFDRIGVEALCSGEDIWLSRRTFRRLDTGDLSVLAHELAHTLQQRSCRVRGSGLVWDPLLEREAEWAARRVTGGQRVHLMGRSSDPLPAGTAVALQPVLRPLQPSEVAVLVRAIDQANGLVYEAEAGERLIVINTSTSTLITDLQSALSKMQETAQHLAEEVRSFRTDDPTYESEQVRVQIGSQYEAYYTVLTYLTTMQAKYPEIVTRALSRFGHVDFQNVIGNMIRPEYVNDIRSRFYPGHWPGPVWNALCVKLAIPNTTTTVNCAVHGAGQSFGIDHIMPVAVHWNGTGNDTDAASRQQWYHDVSNLQIMCSRCNSSKGSGGVFYTPFVGPSFRGS